MFSGCIDIRNCSCVEHDDTDDDWYLRGIGDGQTTMMTGQLKGKMRAIHELNAELNALKDSLDVGAISQGDYHAKKKLILAQVTASGNVGQGYDTQVHGVALDHNGCQHPVMNRIQLVNFYSKHEPSKVPKVDVFLSSLPHDRIDARLLDKYGVSVWHPNGVATSRASQLSPDQELMQKRERLLAEKAKLTAKLGERNAPTRAKQPATRVILTLKALEDFYSIYSPERVERAAQILEQTRGQESELVVALRGKYGAAPELTVIGPSPVLNHAHAPAPTIPIAAAKHPSNGYSTNGSSTNGSSTNGYSNSDSGGAADAEPDSIRLLRAERERLQKELQRMSSDTQVHPHHTLAHPTSYVYTTMRLHYTAIVEYARCTEWSRRRRDRGWDRLEVNILVSGRPTYSRGFKTACRFSAPATWQPRGGQPMPGGGSRTSKRIILKTTNPQMSALPSTSFISTRQLVSIAAVFGVAGALAYLQLRLQSAQQIRGSQRREARSVATPPSTTKWFELKLTDYAPHILVRSKASKWLCGQPLDSCCPLNLVMIFGPARQGKSFLMNLLAGKEDLFEQSAKVEPCTCGVDLANFFPTIEELGENRAGKAEKEVWSWWPWWPILGSRETDGAANDVDFTPQELAMQAQKPRAGFVDVEGQGDRDETYDSLLAMPILLCSQVVIFNWMGQVLCCTAVRMYY
jgi:hypothetical protein